MHRFTPEEPYGSWLAYHGHDAMVLAVIIAVAAAALAVAGLRIRRPIALTRPGPTLAVLMVITWLLSIFMMYVALRVYGIQLEELNLRFATQKVQVGTVFYAFVTFLILFFMTRKSGWKRALGAAFVGTAAAPMLFELPFDLIVMARVYPPVPPSPGIFRALYFTPLFLIELTTISLLTLSPLMRITRGACFALAAMLAIWVPWAAIFGFAFPLHPVAYALNIASKLCCFAAAIMLFVGHKPASSAEA